MTGHTEIDGRDVPIQGGDLITVVFSGGPNPGDAGPKGFWTAVSPSLSRKTTVRWRHGEDPGERFRMLKEEKGTQEHWEIARTATVIRPATREEVIAWLKGHLKDAPFALIYYTTRVTRIIKTDDSFRFE